MQAITAVDSWAGLNPIAPLESRFELTAADAGLRGRALFSAGHGSCARESTVDGIGVSEAGVMAFLDALDGMGARRGKYQPKVRHTDDYPKITITVSFAGGHELELYSASQGETRAPWRLRWGGTVSVVSSDQPYRAWSALLEHLPTDGLDTVVDAARECRPN